MTEHTPHTRPTIWRQNAENALARERAGYSDNAVVAAEDLRDACLEIDRLEEQLEAVRDALLRAAYVAETYATPFERGVVPAWADMAGNLRQIAASIPAKEPKP